LAALQSNTDGFISASIFGPFHVVPVLVTERKEKRK
jgi:hypothetical protein